MKKILITGGAGFIGSHVIEHILKNTDWEITVIDRLNYASSGFDRLSDIDVFESNRQRFRIFTADFTKPIVEGLAKELGEFDYILHMGAETHVDNSIANPEPFVVSNVIGTMRMLDFARTQKNLKAFVYFSTDEVFGPAPVETFYREWDRYNSGNPYAAAKAGGEELCLAYANTYGIPMMITHTMNVFGERQHPEKFIPMTIRKIVNREKVIIHSNKDKTKAGSRFWIHGRNVAAALLFLFERQEIGWERVVPRPTYWRMPNADKYNIVGEKEVDNLEMAQFIHKTLLESGKYTIDDIGENLDYEMVDFHSSRPGHDLRYALNGDKMKGLGWSLPVGFEESLKKTIEWTLEHPEWLYIDGKKI